MVIRNEKTNKRRHCQNKGQRRIKQRRAQNVTVDSPYYRDLPRIHEEKIYMLPTQMQDSATVASSAILIPSSKDLQVVVILLISC